MDNKNNISLTPKKDLDNKKLKAALAKFREDNSYQNVVFIQVELEKATVAVPVIPDKPMDKELVERIMKGEKLSAEEAPKMRPLVVQSKNKDTFLPAFTSMEELPEEYKKGAVLTVPFLEVAKMACRPEVNVKGVVMNPISDNITFHPEFLQNIVKGIKPKSEGEQNVKKVRMTAQQFQEFSRRSVEQMVLPKLFETQKGEFMKKLDDERETFLYNEFRRPYGDKVKCPYNEEEFDLMLLDISDTRQVAIATMPERMLGLGCCHSIYMIWNPETDETWYYTIEKGESGDVLARINQGKREEQGEAPTRGTELSAILDMIEE